MPEDFQFDVFLSHSTKDKAVVRPLAERLREDGVISRDTMRELFRRGEILPEGRTNADEIALISGEKDVSGAGASQSQEGAAAPLKAV